MNCGKKLFCLFSAFLFFTNTIVFAAEDTQVGRSEFYSSLCAVSGWSNTEPLLQPEDPITLEEAVILAINALGYDVLAQVLSKASQESAYFMLAKDFGLLEGIRLEENGFEGSRLITWDEANRILFNMEERLQGRIGGMNGFYAIQSYGQLELVNHLSSVGFGWSRLEYQDDTGLFLNTKRQNGNEYGFPAGYEEPFQAARVVNADALLMVALDYSAYPGGQSLASYVLSHPERRQTVADLIAEQAKNPLDFDGVVIDFENIRADQKENLTAFLQAVKKGLQGKKLYVAVQPVRKPGLVYFDGYDYKAIGNICDKIILMAHDYAAKTLSQAELEIGYTTTPVAPIDEVYYALKAITDPETGVEDLSKIMLQISFDSIALKVRDGKMEPPAGISYGAIEDEMRNGAESFYSKTLESPYIKFTKNNTQFIVWYEDARSVAAKINLARMFRVQEISLWRLGTIPNSSNDHHFNVWEVILQQK